jgi:triosephosphate isomerase
MIVSTGAKYVILGHSERRAYHRENNTDLAKKVDLCLLDGLSVIYCCGELLSERESGNHFELVKTQIEEALFHLSNEQMSKVVIAYEPVWAIGTGVTASSEQAQEMHAYIRTVFADKYGTDIAQNISILYGGSCKPSNAQDIFSKEDVDGGLIGGASLNANDFSQIINAF